MNLEDVFEARLAGEHPEVPEALGDDLKHALAAHEALQFALGETILLPESDADDRTPPQLPADYEIVRELGRGGMGVVYLARQKSLDRLVAVKVLRPGEMAFGPMVRRFLDEAKHLARLRHPNLVSVHEVGEAGGEPYFSMDYIAGESLAELLRRERLSPSRALAILKQAAEGVAHAHQTGIIHRDLKPANILLDAAGRAYVTDFGLARNLTDESDRTHSGAVMGTPQYMSPEQARGETRLVGETTDVHALGAILYEMLTGRPPYGSDSPMQILVRLVHEEPTPPRRIDPRISRDLETISLKALAKQPAARYAAVRAMLEDIHRYETGQPLMARRPGIGHHAKRFMRRYAKLAAAALLAAAVVLAIAPKLFDKSLDDLVNWGEYEHEAGRHYQAVHIFHRAFQQASASQRSDFELLSRIQRCIKEVDDPREAVNLALEVIDDMPDASFGKYDFLVAQALLTRLRGQYPSWVGSYSYENGGKVPNVPEKARPLMQLLEKRMAIALNGPTGTPAERRNGEELLALLRHQLAGRADYGAPDAVQAARATAAYTAAQNPQTTPAELLALTADESLPPELRIQAALRAGEKLEKSGDRQSAATAYAQAYSCRSKFPFYALKAGVEDVAASSSKPTGEGDSHSANFLDAHGRIDIYAAEPDSCAALREAYASWRRLAVEVDHSLPEDLRGGLRFRFQGHDLPRQFHLSLQLETIDNSANHCFIMVPVVGAATWVGIADGHYRLKCNRHSAAYSERKDIASLAYALEVDTSALPAEIEIRGETIDLPPIRLVVPAEIKSLFPADGVSIDLQDAVFRWTPIEGAAKYRVDFDLEFNTSSEQGGGAGATRGVKGLVSLTTTSTNLCLGVRERKELNVLPEELARGRTGLWLVEAYDAKNVLLAKTYRRARFLVARGLDEAGK